MKYYAVKVGRNKGIYNSWEDCQKEVTGFPSAEFKSFNTKEEAINYLEDNIDISYNNIPTCYIDGSYDLKTGNYSFGGVLLVDGKTYEFKKMFLADEYSIYRNVAGEIKGAAFIINYAINRGYKDLLICYDYLGIEKWFDGSWQAKTKISINYVNFLSTIKDKINVSFKKIKSHTNDKFNDLADKLAKEALGI